MNEKVKEQLNNIANLRRVVYDAFDNDLISQEELASLTRVIYELETLQQIAVQAAHEKKIQLEESEQGT